MNMDSSSNPSSPDSERGICCTHEDTFDGRKWNMVDRSKRIRASARERRRRHVLNSALENLRQRVPCSHQNPQKLSKIEVLRMAIDYISLLSYHLENSSSPPYYEFPVLEKQDTDSNYSGCHVKPTGIFVSPGDSLVQHLNLLSDADGYQFLSPDLESLLQQTGFSHAASSYLCRQEEMYMT